MEIIYKKVNELIPYENNPRLNDETVEYVKNSIKEFGFKVPVVIDKDNVIIAGHTRIKASKELGIKDIPCIIADDLTEEQVKAFRLADNKVSEKSVWNWEMLNQELNDILNIDMTKFDFGIDLDEPLEDELDEDENNIELKEYQVKLKFKDTKDFKKIEDELRSFINENYKDVDVSVNGGYI